MQNLRFLFLVSIWLFMVSASNAQVTTTFLYGHGKQFETENDGNGVSEIVDSITELKNNKACSVMFYTRTYYNDKLVDISSSFRDSLSIS